MALPGSRGASNKRPPQELELFEERIRRQARRTAWIAFVCGGMLAILIAVGAAEEHLRGGQLGGSLLVTALVLLAAIVTMTLTQRPLHVLLQAEPGSKLLRLRPMVVLVPQLLGMAAGIGLVHSLFTNVPDSSFGEARSLWLDDAVTSIATLMSIWACAAAKLRFSVLVTMLVGLLGYGLVTQLRASGVLSAQAMVAARVVAIATGLLAFRRFGAK